MCRLGLLTLLVSILRLRYLVLRVFRWHVRHRGLAHGRLSIALSLPRPHPQLLARGGSLQGSLRLLGDDGLQRHLVTHFDLWGDRVLTVCLHGLADVNRDWVRELLVVGGLQELLALQQLGADSVVLRGLHGHAAAAAGRARIADGG